VNKRYEKRSLVSSDTKRKRTAGSGRVLRMRAPAAHLAGICFEEMRDILRKRGIKLGLGPESKEEIEKKVEIIRRKLDELHRKSKEKI